ncbi:MAG TPA: S9 family peptidase [Chloroflexota bacterium]|nr:S9 family peptidase [Chloroflexota bacterium]
MPADTRALTLEDFWSLSQVNDPRLSPDGTTVAYVVTTHDEARNTARSAIWLADLATGHARQFTSGESGESQPRWSPDGRWLAFVSPRHDNTPQVFVIARDGGEPRRITSSEHGAHSPVWSPDGTRLCVSSDLPIDHQRVPQEQAWFAAHPEAETGRQLRRLRTVIYRLDGRGYFDKRTQLFVIEVDAPDAAPRQITEGNRDHQEAAWSPDGAFIAFSASHSEEPEFVNSDIWTIALDGGAITRLTNGELAASHPVWSPDGATVAFQAAYDLRIRGYTDTHLWFVSRAGGDQRDGSVPLDRTCGGSQPDLQWSGGESIVWSPNGDQVFFLPSDHGDTAVFALTVATGTIRRVSDQAAVVSGVQVTPDGRTLVVLVSTPSRPPELSTVPAAGGPLTPLTHANDALLAERDIAPTETLFWRGPDDLEIQGWLVKPAAHAAPGGFPLIVHIHGGPSGAWGHHFYFQAQVLAGLGYASFYPNPRGSLGYGEGFCKLSDGGDKDYQDILAGLDAVLASGACDPERVGITGISYGGFMTNWALGQDDRFAAGVSVNGVANHVSFHGTSDIAAPWFQSEMGGGFWESPERFEHYRRHSPISYVDRISAPLLLIQSEDDLRCPITQGEEMFAALRMRGKTVELVRFPGANHVIALSGTPVQKYMQWKLAIDWFGQHLAKHAE